MVVTACSHGVCSMWQQLCISGSNENSSLCMRYDNVILRFYLEQYINQSINQSILLLKCSTPEGARTQRGPMSHYTPYIH